MTAQEVVTELGKLPEPENRRCLEAFKNFPNTEREPSGGINRIAIAIDAIDWEAAASFDYFLNLYNRANDGEFDTPQPDDDTMISVSSNHYSDISEKADKYDRMLEIARENAQNKKDEH